MALNPLVRSRSAERAVARFQRVLDEFVGVLGNLGALAAVDVAGVGRIRFAAGAATVAGDVPARPDHLFQIGSQSKTFVAVALFDMARAGMLSLDDRVVDHLDLPIDRRITARHLITNTSGLGEYTMPLLGDRWDPRLAITPRDLVTLALPQGQIFPPGDHFDYCNTGWVIAALLIEKLARKPHHEVIRERVTAPLGLAATRFDGTPQVSAMLRGYVRSGAVPEPADTAGALDWAWGAGAGVSSLDDMLDFFGSLIRPESPLGVSLADLTRETGKASANPYFPLSIGVEYGTGLERRAWAGSECWGHPGSTMAYLTSSWVDPALRVTVTTCVTRVARIGAADADLRYPRAQLFAMALNTAYALAEQRPAG